MDRRLVLELVRVTEAAAIACYPMVGRGDGKGADAKAVEAMRLAFDRCPMRGTVVIGEGERDEAPMLYIGEKVGPREETLPEVDIAVDPLEGTDLCAGGWPGAMATLAMANRGDLLHCPDTYMKKVAAGPAGRGVIALEKTPTQNVHDLADAMGRRPPDITAVVLDRPRHMELISELRGTGARVFLVDDGDVAPAVATGFSDTEVDLLYGTGGAPEGVLAASALHCLGGEFQGKLAFRNDDERRRATEMGIEDLDAILHLEDIVRGDVIFVATGVTTGPLLRGVRRDEDRLRTHSIALRSTTGTVRYVDGSVRADRFL